MPIVDVELVGGPGLGPEVTRSLADALGEALAADVGRTWVRVRHLPADRYAEHGGVDGDVHPVFVTVLERIQPTGPDLAYRVARITAAVAETTERDPANVHVLFEPGAKGRLAFGGRVVE